MAETVADGGLTGADVIEVAYAKDEIEAEMIQGLLEGGGIPSFLQPVGLSGPSINVGLLPNAPKRVMAHADKAAAARRLLAETLVEDEREAEPEMANARNLDDARGAKPRGYGLIGGYARIYLWSLGALGVVFGVFLLLHAV